ncbi:hypothetical protein Tco_0506617 [Tanacetum coccineum]
MTSRRPSILNRSSTQTQTELPTQEDQIRGYRQMARNRHQVARTTRRVFGRNNYNRTLETAVDPERQLEISRERRANLVPAEVLYSNNRSTARHRVYEHYSEQRILCVGENQINLRLCNEESYESLRNSGLQHIHLGIFMIRLHALHRRTIILEEEPLNKVRRSNKPKRSKQKSWEKWSTLGEPSRKWDYYVMYDAPPDQAKEYYENKAAMQKKEEIWQSKESLLVRDLTDALKIIDQLGIKKERLEEHKRLEEQKDEEIRELKAQLQKKKEEAEVQFSREEFPPLGNTHVARPCIETEVHYSGNATASPKIRKITNQLYNVKVEFDIPNYTAFGTTAIIDTGAPACCINKKVIPKEALEPLTQIVIPLIYAFDMRDSNGIEMMIGANFLRSMKGGIRIEGEITSTKEINESIYLPRRCRASRTNSKIIIDRLCNARDTIGEEPLKHWKKNGELCKLDIINPDITIEDRPLKHVTPAMEDLFRKHVDSLLKIGAIRPSKCRHRTMAMIVNSGTTIDPVTGREVKGKERMVFNYKSLNDNTYKDQYSLPGINTIIKRIGAICDRDFMKVVMPFRHENLALQYYSKKDDKCFKGTESFIAVYIDDILVFSKNEKDHAKHLERMLKICEDNGLKKKNKQVWSYLNKMKYQSQQWISDGCMEGWGGIVKWKKSKEDPRSSERISNKSSRVDGIKFADASQNRMHRRNEGISSSSSLLSGGKSSLISIFTPEELRGNCTNATAQRYALDNHKDKPCSDNEKMFEFKIKKPEESSSNWKPWHKDWDATTSNHSEDDAIKDDGKYRYNRKGFLEDDESDDDSILIMDPGWDDYCLQTLKLNRPIPLCQLIMLQRILIYFTF